MWSPWGFFPTLGKRNTNKAHVLNAFINKQGEILLLQEGDEDYVRRKHPFRIYVTYNT